MADEPATTVILYDAVGIGTYQRGRRPLYKATHNAVIVEMIPQGAGAEASLTVVDSADEVSGYEPSIDGESQQANVVQYQKVILTKLLPYVNAQLTVAAGTWTIKLTAINIPNSEVVTISGTINQGNAGAQAWPVDVSDRAGRQLGVIAGGTAPGAGPIADGLPAMLYGPNGQTLLPAAAPLADGAANPTTTAVDARLSAYNGATWDRQHGNTQLTLLASAARTAQAQSPLQMAYNARGVTFTLIITAAPNTAETLLLGMYAANPSDGGLADEWAGFVTQAGSAMQGTFPSHWYLTVYPGSSGVPPIPRESTLSMALPGRQWYGLINPSGASSWTYALYATSLV